MRKLYFAVLLALMVIAAGCISPNKAPSPTSTTSTTSPNLPFTAEDMKRAIEGMQSYEYSMKIETYNGTKLAGQLATEGAVDIKEGLKSIVTVSNSTAKGFMYYRTYYYTTRKGYASLIDRNGTVTWEAACYGQGEGPNLTTSILDNLWQVLNFPSVEVEEEGDYYIIHANTTSGTIEGGTRDVRAYKTQVEVKLTKDLIPVAIRETVHYTRNGQRWVDVITVDVWNVNRAEVTPPEELVNYLEEQGVNLEELLAKC